MHMLAIDSKNNAVVTRKLHAPKSFQITSQGVKSETGQVDIFGFLEHVKKAENTLGLIDNVRSDLAPVAVAE